MSPPGAEIWRRRQAKAWTQARRDFEAGEWMAACFWAQQAAEFALKSNLEYDDRDVPRTHRLDDLLQLIGGPSDLLAAAANLSPMAVTTRYFDTEDRFTEAIAAQAMKDAEALIKWSEA